MRVCRHVRVTHPLFSAGECLYVEGHKSIWCVVNRQCVG